MYGECTVSVASVHVHNQWLKTNFIHGYEDARIVWYPFPTLKGTGYCRYCVPLTATLNKVSTSQWSWKCRDPMSTEFNFLVSSPMLVLNIPSAQEFWVSCLPRSVVPPFFYGSCLVKQPEFKFKFTSVTALPSSSLECFTMFDWSSMF